MDQVEYVNGGKDTGDGSHNHNSVLRPVIPKKDEGGTFSMIFISRQTESIGNYYLSTGLSNKQN
jgi:hypothetical protein